MVASVMNGNTGVSMKTLLKHILIIASIGICVACSEKESSEQTPQQTNAPSNPLLQAFDGPYQGVPAFDSMELSNLDTAMREAMQLTETEYEAIANNSAPATFDNTIAALEKGGAELDRAYVYWGIWSNNLSSPEFRDIQKALVPELSAFQSRYKQNEALFKRIESIYKGEEFAELDAYQQRVTETYYRSFFMDGANLNGEDKKRYAEIDQQLAELYTEFGNNTLADEEKYVVYLSEFQLSGLPQSVIDAAASAAKERGEETRFAITNTRSSMDPFLRYSDERKLREQVWTNYYSRGDNGDENDNKAIATKILKLRDERVGMLGYENFAQWRLEDRMAATPENAMALLESVWPAAIARVAEEVADMQALADAEAKAKGTEPFKIAPWDYRYYAEKVRLQKYALDSDEVKQYLQLDKLREAMFFVAKELFKFNFTEITDGSVPVFHEDVRVWEVTNSETGEHVGLWYLDPFARKGKRSGAWATSYRIYSTFDGKKNVLSSNNSNFIKGQAGEAVLISWDDAETYFHEFGHALHSLSSNVPYPRLNYGVRDYTEFQSQLLERWLFTNEVINNYLVHHETGEPIPAELVEKIKNAATFNEGFKTTEYLASAIIDMKLHTLDDLSEIDLEAFEKETLAELGMPDELVMRHRTPHFGHIFTNEAYSAGYYGYLWAEVLTSDAAEAFAEAEGGFYDKALAEKLVTYLFSVRNAIEPAEAYRLFRGRDANSNALMRDRGFPVEE